MQTGLLEHGNGTITVNGLPVTTSDIPPVQLSLRDMSYTIHPGKKNEKRIVTDISADFKPKELVAVMGPSGAGKTTILNVMTLNAGGRVDGEVLANGRPLHRGFKAVMNLVPQDDVLLPALTVRETLQYAADLRMPMSVPKAERWERVEDIISALNLSECADTIVGSVERRGISGGQRKRVSIGLELLNKPSVLFLDEPTSGLDSKAAEDVCKILHELATRGHTVICTIHQPSWKLYCKFDSLLLLAAGRVVYRGPTSDLPGHFAALGHPSSSNENPVDHVLRIIQEQEPEHFVTAVRSQLADIPTELEPIQGVTYTTSRTRQFSTLFRRNCYDFLKDPEKFVSLCMMKLGISVIIGICWWKAGNPAKASNVFALTGVMFMFTMNCMMDNLFDTVMRFPASKQLYLREYKNGCYSSIAWFFAYMGQVLVFQTVFALILALPAYFMIGLRSEPEIIIVALACLLLASCIGMSAGVLMGVISKDLQQAQGSLLPLIVPMILFSGYVLPYDNIPSYFQWFYYIDVFQFSFTILRINQFRGLIFEKCTLKEQLQVAFCNCIEGSCTGNEYLKAVNVDPTSHNMRMNFLYMVTIFLVFLIPTYFAIRWKGNQKTG